jgi:hypothetical protein
MEAAINIITSPFIQLFILGLLAGFFRSDLKIPEAFTKMLSIYLMLAIGLKGGVEINKSDLPFAEIFIVLLTGVVLSFLLPFLSYALIRKTCRLDRLNAAAVSAHYGSVSAVTFGYAMGYLGDQGIHFEGYLVTLMALMEFPAILSGLILAKRSKKLESQSKEKLLSMKLIQEVFLNGSIVLLIGGLIIGMSGNEKGMAVIKPYLIDPFYGILGLFLLELGLVAARRLKEVENFPFKLAMFGIYMPLISAVIGTLISNIFGFDVGTTILLSTLAASASYIAVPAAMKIALPEANPAYYVTLSLCITFPFNLIVGVPLYTWMAGL